MSEKETKVYAVLLAGGSGTRLWPVSRHLFPKQLVGFTGDESLIQSTLKRLTPVIDSHNIRIVCGEEQAAEIAVHIQEAGMNPEGKTIGEPCGRNTAPAVLLATLSILRETPDAILGIFPADHVIGDINQFHTTLKSALELAQRDYIVTFGIRPDYPETGYGYIEGGSRISGEAVKIKRFVEKPDFNKARDYIKAGNFYWNSGMFAFKASVMFKEFEMHAPEILKEMRRLVASKEANAWERYKNLPNISFDYAIMEKTAKGALVPSDFGWSDIGSWKSLYDYLPADEKGNVIMGDVISKETENSLIMSHGRLVATNRIKNLVIVETADSVFVSDLDHSRDVKTIVEQLKAEERPEFYTHKGETLARGSSAVLKQKDDPAVKDVFKVPLLDLKSQYQTIKQEIWEAVDEVFDSQHFILGPKVEAFEKEIATYCRTKYAVGVSSGTDALLISLMAAGIGPDDGVITTTYSFFATAGCIARLGAQPIFVDIDPNSYNISPESLDQVLAKMPDEMRRKLKAIIPVHLYGQCAQMKPIRELARKYDLCIIEDAAQAIGAEYEGSRAGSIGDFGCFSFFPTKNLGAFGDGGAVTTSSDECSEKLRILRAHGSKPKYYHHIVGGNFRLDALQAAVVLIKLKHLDQWSRDRQENARKYRDFFHKAGMDDIVELPLETGGRHIFNQFIISVKEKRDELRRYLNASGIGTEIYYPVPLHLQACFEYLNYKPGDFPNAEHAAKHTLALPIYPELTDAQQEYVVAKIKQFYQN